MQELERAKVIEAYAKGEIKAGVAALRLQVSPRQVQRLLKRFLQDGLSGLASQRRGKPSNNRINAGTVQKALSIVRERYSDFGPTLACEKLLERHKVKLSKETLRQLMIDAGIWIPRDARRSALYQPRERRACFGEMVQIDGSRHAWFEGRRAPCALLVFVDDATGRILQLHFSETETADSYFEAMQPYLKKYGKPMSFYADRAAVFRSPAANRYTPTQFQRAADELGIKLICAKSPQAKGRVERANRTLQDRLVKEMRLDKIEDIESANRWAKRFIKRHNKHFAYTALSQLDAHTPLRASDDLKRILSIQETRKLTSKLTLQHGARQYLLRDEPALRVLVGQSITIHNYRDGTVELRFNGSTLPYSVLEGATRNRHADVDTKGVHHEVDQLPRPTKRKRLYRENQAPTLVAEGVMAAKKMALHKRVSTRQSS
jgi:transposase